MEDEADVKLANLEARHGTARHGTARHGTARHGTARHGTARHGTARHGTARHGTRNPTTNDALASALEAYGDLVDELRDEPKAFKVCELGTIDEACELAPQLRESAGPGPSSDAAKQAIELRDGLFVQLRRRMRIVRRGAEFVFQKEPEIVKELASACERRRRGRSRAVAEEAGGGGAHGGVGVLLRAFGHERRGLSQARLLAPIPTHPGDSTNQRGPATRLRRRVVAASGLAAQLR